MASPNFPSTGLVPNVTTFTVGNIIYKWDGEKWKTITADLSADQIKWTDSKTAGYGLDDLQGFTEALLDDAGIVPSGQPDTVGASQRLDALKTVVRKHLELKIFQSPTDNLTKVSTFAGGAGVVYEVRKTSDNSLATIYSDAAGSNEIVQDGTSNVSNANAEVVFYIVTGDYTVTINSVSAVMYVSSVTYVNSIKQLLDAQSGGNRHVSVASYHDISDLAGGGVFVWSGNTPKKLHNGGTVIDPDMQFPASWADTSEFGAVWSWFFGNQDNSGFGCWVRQSTLDVNVKWFGAKADGVTDDTVSFNAATGGYLKYNESNFSNVSDLKRAIIVDGTKSSYKIEGTVYIRKGQELKGLGLGESRIFIPVIESDLHTFNLGEGVEKNPYPENSVSQANSGSTTVTLSGNIKGGNQYVWLGKDSKIRFDITDKWYTVESVSLGVNTTITLTEPLVDSVPIGSLISWAVVTDSGGLPPSISNLATEGGHVGAAVIFGRKSAGMSMNTLFITSAPLGIKGAGGDVNIHTVTFDMGGVGLALSGSRNSVTGCHFFWNNFGIMVTTGAYDWTVSGCTFGFQKFADVEYSGKKDTVRHVNFDNCSFFLNEQYAGHLGSIHIQSGNPKTNFTGCVFSNLVTWAINSVSADDPEVIVRDCVFDGQKSNAEYIQSSSMRGVRIGNGKWTVSDCLFKNIHRDFFEVSQASTNSYFSIKNNTVEYGGTSTKKFVKINSLGGGVSHIKGNTGDRNSRELIETSFSFPPAPKVKLEKNNEFYPVSTSGGRKFVKVPTTFSTSFLVQLSYNGNTTSSAYYSKSAIFSVDKGTVYNGAVVDYVTGTQISPAAPGSIPAPLDVDFDFDSVGAGNALPFKNSVYREIVISVPSDADSIYITML